MSANSREAEKIEIAASAANNEVNTNKPSIESSAPVQDSTKMKLWQHFSQVSKALRRL